MVTQLTCGDRVLDLTRPQVMGVLNVTPDSFSDGGAYSAAPEGGSAGFFVSVDKALERAAQMLHDGAAIIDVGGESTRPGAEPVSPSQELDRVIPVVEALRRELDVIVSVDTSTPEVIREAASAGAGMINDVRALQREGAMSAAAGSGLAVCLMHMQGEPGTMQEQPQYEDVVEDVYRYLLGRVASCEFAGMDRRRLLVDPGFGFGKTLEQNYQLLAGLRRFGDMGLPVLVGMSRKSMIGRLLDRPVEQRLSGSLAAATAAILAGARIIRVHDVAETLDVARVCAAVLDPATAKLKE